MVAAQQEPDQLGRPIGDALGEPLLKSMSAEVQAEVLGDVAPGLQPFAAVREEKLDELPAEKGLDSISLPTWIILAGLALVLLVAVLVVRSRAPRGYEDSTFGFSERSARSSAGFSKLASGTYSDSD